MKSIYKIIPALLLFFFVGCTEKIDLDLDSIPPAIVIEGRITNGQIFNYVRVTQSSPYLSEEPNQPVVGALVTLTEDGTVTETLTEDPQFPGYYYAPLLWAGKLNAAYKLSVTVGGETYEAIDTIRPVTPLDSLTYAFDDKVGTDDDGYYVTIHTQEPPGLGNNYQWLYFSNGIEVAGLEWIGNDEFVDGSYVSFQFEMEEPQELGDTVVVEMAAISPRYFTFVTQLLNQESFGNLFDTPPANVLGNFSNGAFGYFHAAGVVADTIILQ